MVTSIHVRVETISHQPFVRNLGVILDQDMAMDKPMGIICKTSQHHLRNMGNVTKFLDQGSAETLVHSFVLLSVPRSRTVTHGDRTFPIPGPKLWNDLQDSLPRLPTSMLLKVN